MRSTDSNLWKVLWHALSVIIVSIIVVRAYTIPVTHDEAATVIHYAARFSPWQIMMFPDPWPNNHILNTLLTKMSIGLFGEGHLAIRLPSIFSVTLYLWAIWRLISILVLKKSILSVAALLAFLSLPQLLDFFSICRGYGLSSAMVLLSVSFVVTAMQNSRDRHLVYAILIAILSSYANFSSLVYWAALVLGVGIYLIFRKTDVRQKLIHVSCLGVSSLMYLALIAQPLIKMRSTNQFKYWKEGSFYNETIVSLSQFWIDGQYGVQPKTIAIGVTISIGAMLIFVVRQGIKKGINVKDPMVIIPTFFLLTLFVENMQVLLLHTPHLSGRVAVFLFPLYMASLICLCIAGIRKFNISSTYKFILGIVLFFGFGLHIYKTLDMKKTHLWWYDQYNIEMLTYLRETNVDNDQLRLNVNWMFHPSLNYYTTVDSSLEWLTLDPYSKNIDEKSEADFYFVLDSDRKTISEKYEIIHQFGDRHFLMKLKD